MSTAPSRIAGLLHRWNEGDRQALDELAPIVYGSLHRLAHQRLREAPAEHSLNTTALVHEAYLRLAGARNVNVRDRGHFLLLASRVMRCLLADHARARMAAKRGGGAGALELREGIWMAAEDVERITDLDEALSRLEQLAPRQSRILEQRYFGGLSLEETAAAMDLSLATVKRELRSARAWLLVELRRESAP